MKESEYKIYLKRMNRHNKAMEIFMYSSITLAMILLFIKVIRTKNFRDKMMIRYDTCVKINEDLYCKVVEEK